MGKSNPSGRGYASAYTSSRTNQYTAGGNAKAGLGAHIGMGPFINAAINHGAAGHSAPKVSGKNWFKIFGTEYPVPCTNQLSGVGMPRRGMWNASADGVPKENCRHPENCNTCCTTSCTNWLAQYPGASCTPLGATPTHNGSCRCSLQIFCGGCGYPPPGGGPGPDISEILTSHCTPPALPPTTA